MEDRLEIYVKNVYGVDKVYPHCDKAKVLATLAGTKTLTPDTLRLARKLGFTFWIVGTLPLWEQSLDLEESIEKWAGLGLSRSWDINSQEVL